MRIGTVGIGRIGTDATIVISGGTEYVDPGIVPGTPQSGGYTSGPTPDGDTMMCPPGFPYDYSIHDCHGYSGSPGDVQEMTLQAAMDVCTSGGRQWIDGRCATPAGANQLIPGVPNIAVYAVAGLLAFVALKPK